MTDDPQFPAIWSQVTTALSALKKHPVVTRAPLSPFSITQKMGFKPVVHCSCGASLDLNVAKTNERRAWRAEHQEHWPQETAS